MRRLATALLAVIAAVSISFPTAGVTGQPASHAVIDDRLFAAFGWRQIGPFRGGLTTAATGTPDQPNVFYMGTAGGGVWKTNDYGRSWQAVFDGEATGSIDSLAVAPTDGRVVYAGTALGLYRSDDAGATWMRLGLRDGGRIARIAVDPHDARRLFAAVPGHRYGPNEERGIFRSTDGGATFAAVLHRDENTGGGSVAIDPSDPDIIYATRQATREAPWEGGVFRGPGGGLFKSTDGGSTWQAAMSGLPTFETDGLGRISVAIAPSRTTRLYALVGASTRQGLYRSDDGGGTWTHVNGDAGPADSASGMALAVDPANPDVVFTGIAGAWKSTDAGLTFAARAGRPGGESVHDIWLNPTNAGIIVAAGDHGAAITVNGGDTWSSTETQPTGRFDSASTDTAFPYRVCGGQAYRDAGCTASRGDAGRVTPRDWTVVGPDGWGSVAPDPDEPAVVYSGRAVSRHNRRTGQTQDVGPQAGAAPRAGRTAPLLFAPAEPGALLFGADVLWKTTNGGQSWSAISPDLSRDTREAPPNAGIYQPSDEAAPVRRGSIAAVAPSPLDRSLIWAGTDDGRIHVTRNAGRNWTDVTPSGLEPWARVSGVEASRFDRNTAYAAVDRTRLGDDRPVLYRTRDGGQTWTSIVRGLPARGAVHVVREDLFRRGLLVAGTDSSVQVSFDDGDRWQPLRLNMPATPVRDLAVRDTDLVAATTGRGFWILDDITPLRQITPDIARAPAYLFRPAPAWRVRSQTSRDGAWRSGEPAAPNPPEGVVIAFLVGEDPPGPVALEIVEPVSGEVIRRYGTDAPEPLPTGRGLHRLVWDLRYPPPATLPVATSAGLSSAEPVTVPGLLVTPGTYQVRLTAGDRLLRQALTVRMDPRVTASTADLALQHRLSRSVHDAMAQLAAADRDVAARLSEAAGADRGPLESRRATLAAAYEPLPGLFRALQSADARPTPTLEQAVAEALERVREALLLSEGVCDDAPNPAAVASRSESPAPAGARRTS